jgi:hypothetical protein
MSFEAFENKSSSSEEPAVQSLLTEITCFLKDSRLEAQMQRMDEEVADATTLEDYQRYAPFKELSLRELAEINQTPGLNAALRAAIERGFIIGYWMAMQHAKAEQN